MRPIWIWCIILWISCTINSDALRVGEKPYLYQGSGSPENRSLAGMPQSKYVFDVIKEHEVKYHRQVDDEILVNFFKTKADELTEHVTAKQHKDLVTHLEDLVVSYRVKQVAEMLTDNRPEPHHTDKRCRGGWPKNLDVPSVYVINLKRRTDRRKNMEKSLPAVILSSNETHFWEATDGKTISATWMLDHGFKQYDNWTLDEDDPLLRVLPGNGYRLHKPMWHNLKYWTRPLNIGDMGCLISHVRLWREIKRRRLPYIILLEDDVHVSEEGLCSFVYALKDLNHSHTQWDLAYGDTGKWFGDAWNVNTDEGRRENSDLDTRWAPLGLTYSTWTMAVSLEGAKGLLDFGIHRCLHTIDDFVSFSYNSKSVKPTTNVLTPNPSFGHPRGDEFMACLRKEYENDPELFDYQGDGDQDGDIPSVLVRRKKKKKKKKKEKTAMNDSSAVSASSTLSWSERRPRQLRALRWRGADVVAAYIDSTVSDIDGDAAFERVEEVGMDVVDSSVDVDVGVRTNSAKEADGKKKRKGKNRTKTTRMASKVVEEEKKKAEEEEEASSKTTTTTTKKKTKKKKPGKVTKGKKKAKKRKRAEKKMRKRKKKRRSATWRGSKEKKGQWTDGRQKTKKATTADDTGEGEVIM